MIRDFLQAFDALPTGTFTGTSQGHRYLVTRQDSSDGGSQKLVAEELGGPDYVSFNLYRLTSGIRLRPCELPEKKAVEFVLDFRVIRRMNLIRHGRTVAPRLPQYVWYCREYPGTNTSDRPSR